MSFKNTADGGVVAPPADVLHSKSRERYRRAALSTAAAASARGLTIINLLISAPLALHYLGPDRYGLWMTIGSLAAFVSLADLGFGNGLVNAIARANGADDRDAARVSVSSAFLLLMGIAFAGGALLAIGYALIPWASALGAAPDAAGDAGPAAVVFIACVLIGLPLGVASRVQSGYQEGFVSSVWVAAGNLLGFLFLVAAIELHLSLPWLVAAVAGTPRVADAANTLVLFTVRRPWLRPHRAFVRRCALRSIARSGSFFFVIQTAAAVAYETDLLILAHLRGPADVTRYSLTLRLAGLVPLLLGFIVVPLWPAYGEALARGDAAWLRRTLRRSLLVGLGLNVPAAVVLTTSGATLIRVWVGPAAEPTRLLLIGFSIWIVLTAIAGPVAMFLNGVDALAWQAGSAVAMAVANLALSIVLTYRIGVAGPILGSVIAQLLFVVLPYVYYVPRTLGKLEHGVAGTASTGLVRA